ncbi:hypothetical protein G3A39_42750 [Paraburkholderia aspalathi]|nr:hypothetical protein [Paraburkholderia aspalathi]
MRVIAAALAFLAFSGMTASTEETQRDGEAKICLSRVMDDYYQEILSPNLDSIMKRSIGDLIQRRRIDENYCMEQVNCFDIENDVTRDGLDVKSMLFDKCLKEIDSE